MMLLWLLPPVAQVPALARAEAPPRTGALSGTPKPQPSAQRYELEATLNPVTHQVRGTLQLSLTNTSARPLNELVFHLFLNAFRDQDSVFMRESGGGMRGVRSRTQGSIEVEQLEVDGVNVLDQANFELVKGDFTQLLVPLASELAVGSTVHISATFVSKLPAVFARSGYADDFHCVAQWFPKLAKLEPSGEFTSFPYHALGEFYADFADYKLTVRTPARFTVGANGSLVSEAREGDAMVRTYVSEHVLDSVWIAGEFLQTEHRSQEGVDVHYLYADGYELSLEEHADIVTAGLQHFGRLLGPYPYPTLTVVLPPRRASGAAGMEYPALFLTQGFWAGTPSSPGLSGAFVTAHELAHQWFSVVLANNELRYPVLDEGFAEWAAIDLLRTRFGESGALSSFLPFSRFEAERLAAFAGDHAVPAGAPAPSFTASEYGASVYSAAAVALETIRRVYGRERFEAALRAYSDQNRFSHPTPEALAHAFDGIYGRGFSARIVLPLLLQGERVDLRITQAKTKRSAGRYVTEVRARRTGNVPLPTWLAAFDARGKELTRVKFPGETTALHATLETEQPVAQVLLDPDRALLVDPSVRNQVVTFQAPPRTDWKSRLIALAQALSSWIGP